LKTCNYTFLKSKWRRRLFASIIHQNISEQLTYFTALGKPHISTLALLKTGKYACQNRACLNGYNHFAVFDDHTFKCLFLQKSHTYSEYQNKRQKCWFDISVHFTFKWIFFPTGSKACYEFVWYKRRYSCYFHQCSPCRQ